MVYTVERHQTVGINSLVGAGEQPARMFNGNGTTNSTARLNRGINTTATAYQVISHNATPTTGNNGQRNVLGSVWELSAEIFGKASTISGLWYVIKRPTTNSQYRTNRTGNASPQSPIGISARTIVAGSAAVCAQAPNQNGSSNNVVGTQRARSCRNNVATGVTK